MNFDRRQITKGLSASLLAGAALTSSSGAVFAQKKKLRIGMVVKVLGINYFDVSRDGGLAAAKELGDVDVIYAGPTAATVEQQIAVIDTLIAQRVDVLAISANDAQALVPTTKKAMQRGIVVLSFDSGIAPEGRAMQISAPHDELVGANDVRMISKTIGGKGEIAILSATSQATNQNIWIEKMKDELKKPDYADVKLVAVVYGDDAADKSYREAQGLIKGHPDLRGIISPTAVGIIGACRAVTDAGLIGKIFVTGHGLPSEMKPNILSGVCETFQLWNPADLGYAAVTFGTQIARGEFKPQPGLTAKVGRLGDMTIETDDNVFLKSLLVFDKSNIEQFAAQF
jgi:rhamnose transport system substrate-binding protein